MSVNSRNRSSEIHNSFFPHASLSAQKATINDIIVDHALGVVIFFVVTFGFLAWHLIESSLIKNGFLNKAEADTMTLYIAAMGLPIFIWCSAEFVRSFRIHRQLSKITYAVEEPISIHCSKVSFIYKLFHHHSSLIISVIIKDENGNRFYYVYPEKRLPSESATKHIKKSLTDHDITIICYQGTNIVKALSKISDFL